MLFPSTPPLPRKKLTKDDDAVYMEHRRPACVPTAETAVPHVRMGFQNSPNKTSAIKSMDGIEKSSAPILEVDESLRGAGGSFLRFVRCV